MLILVASEPVSAVWLLIFLAPVAFLIFLFFVSILERKPVVPYVLLDAREAPLQQGLRLGKQFPHPSQLSDYTLRMMNDAMDAGLSLEAMIAHMKVPSIRIVGAVMWSADRRVLMLSGSGTVANMAAYQTWLFTPLADGRYLVTTDKNDEGDHSGTYIIKRLLNVPMGRLFVVHMQRVQEHAAMVRAVTQASAFEALLAIYRQRAERTIAQGLGRYHDPERNYWRYTPTGGVRVVMDFFKQLANALTQFWRVNKRPIASPRLKPVGTLQFD